MAPEHGSRMTEVIQMELRNSRRDPHGEQRFGVRGLSILEEMEEMDSLELERQESEYWAKIWEKSLDPHE